VVGTFGYMAPEQFQGRALQASDVYAVGATALSLVTGREPEDLPHRGLAIDVRAALGSGAEPWLVRALSAMLDPDPDKRATRVPAPGSGRRASTNSERPSPPRPTARASDASTDDWRELRDRGRETRRQIREESRRLRHEIKQQVREETRRARRLARSIEHQHRNAWHDHGSIDRHRRGFGGPPLLILILALTAARIGVWALFRFFLPTLLFALSIPFGRPLRRAAFRVRELGVNGDRGLSHALDVVRGRALGSEIETQGEEIADIDGNSPTRTRVPNAPARVDADVETELDDDRVEPHAERGRREQR
jgi:hypothetical protein